MEKYIPRIGVFRLKDLIKSIRACKTAADERAVIARESAAIRTAFKEENLDSRHQNVAKLLYIHMLGYPAHFGQMECLKLAASPRFADKRLGYLGIMLLLDENQEVLTLVTNCLKNDMNNSNMFIVGLALCTMGNISSPEMARDLSMEVEKLLGSSNSYIRKKAALCALRIIKKVPDLMENYQTKVKGLLNERNHAVLLTGVTLLTEMCMLSQEILNDSKLLVPVLVRHLKNLVTAGYSPEHDVSGITDPFLQVKILRLMRLLGKGDATASDAMNDILAQVATNTESSKNVGNAILYETVLTIMDIESESPLKVLGINILGKFLGNRDNNIRTSASAAVDSTALQRHRTTILDCLRDPDISIRRRALDLSFYLIAPQNIRILTRELLSFLEVCEGEIKSSVASRICDVAGRYRPNKRWEVDTVIRVLRVAGSWVDQRVVNTFIKLVSTGPQPLQGYGVRKLYNIVKHEGEKALSQEGMLQATVWCIGEFGDLLVSGVSLSSDPVADEEDGGDGSGGESPPSEREVFELFSSILRGPYATTLVKWYSVTALVKLTSRFKDDGIVTQIRSLVVRYRTNMDMELQQRAVEYTQFWSLSMEQRLALLEMVPVLESAQREEARKGTGEDLSLSAASQGNSSQPKSTKPADDIFNDLFGPSTNKNTSTTVKKDDISDLFGEIGLGGKTTPATKKGQPNNMDLLGDLFNGGTNLSATSNPVSNNNMLDDLFGNSSASVQPAQKYTCYSKNNLLITMSPIKINGTDLQITTTFSCSYGEISGLQFQVAVPKSLKLTMDPPSGTHVKMGKPETQMLKIENPNNVPVRLRLKVGYIVGTNNFEEVVIFEGFN
ncbi:clathrin associated protein complex large subunit [Clydaea vesicula]|uniref:AP-1 complex subunit gamma n=1 Tax=Clydaea vesicula TaxID=447962 RepID=A0AAD5UAT0_9FUNG|nr:clathrin associated protein complex large subunit [Clydaea vesicula]